MSARRGAGARSEAKGQLAKKRTTDKAAARVVTVIPVEELPEMRVGGIVFVPDGPGFRVPEGHPPFGADRFYASVIAWVMTGQNPPELALSPKTTPADLHRARQVILRIATALFSGNPDGLQKLQTVEAVLRDWPTNETEQLAHYRKVFSFCVTAYRDMQKGHWGGKPSEALEIGIARFAMECDKAFEKLTVVQMEKAFNQISEKLGPGETGGLRAAAEMAVHVGAFDTHRTDDFAADVQRMMGRLRKATNAAGKMAAKKKALRRA